jgi:hypothetical protein
VSRIAGETYAIDCSGATPAIRLAPPEDRRQIALQQPRRAEFHSLQAAL